MTDFVTPDVGTGTTLPDPESGSDVPTLTPLEQRILEAVQAHNSRTGFPATNADVCDLMGYRGRASAHPYLRSLLRQGLVVKRGRQGYVAAGYSYARGVPADDARVAA